MAARMRRGRAKQHRAAMAAGRPRMRGVVGSGGILLAGTLWVLAAFFALMALTQPPLASGPSPRETQATPVAATADSVARS